MDRHDQALAGHATQACQGRPKAPGNQDTWKPDQLRSGSAVDFQDTPISLDDAELQELPPEEHLTDGMAISFLDEEDSGFFGIRHCSYSLPKLWMYPDSLSFLRSFVEHLSHEPYLLAYKAGQHSR